MRLKLTESNIEWRDYFDWFPVFMNDELFWLENVETGWDMTSTWRPENWRYQYRIKVNDGT
jgi:hypothetical protein